MTRHRDEATLSAGHERLQRTSALKARLSRARKKDATLDYVERRMPKRSSECVLLRLREKAGPRGARAVLLSPASAASGPEPAPAALLCIGGMLEAGDPIERFKEAQREFIRVAGRFDLDPTAKVRADDLREEMKSAAQEIAMHPDRMREDKRAGIGGQVKRLVRQAERERGRKKGNGLDLDEGLER